PWSAAMGNSMLARLALQQGRLDDAMAHINQARPVLERIGADDDVAQLLAWEVLIWLARGDVCSARADFAELESLANASSLIRNSVVMQTRAEIELASGNVDSAL